MLPLRQPTMDGNHARARCTRASSHISYWAYHVDARYLGLQAPGALHCDRSSLSSHSAIYHHPPIQQSSFSRHQARSLLAVLIAPSSRSSPVIMGGTQLGRPASRACMWPRAAGRPNTPSGARTNATAATLTSLQLQPRARGRPRPGSHQWSKGPPGAATAQACLPCQRLRLGCRHCVSRQTPQ